MKKILVLSFYYYPDLCAGSFRNTPFVKELSKQIGNKNEIHVITTMPNRYKSFKAEALKYEQSENITINRIKISSHKNGFIDQIISFFIFYRGALKIARKENYNLVYASSSRLFTAYLGFRIARKKNIPLYLDMRDIFVETMDEVLKGIPFIKNILLKFIRRFIEKPTFSNAKHINLVSEGFINYFGNYDYPNFSFYTNGIDEVFLNLKQNKIIKWPTIITYAGNIGEGQGLEKIVPSLALKLGDKYLLKIIGDGGAKQVLQKKILEFKLNNVELIDPLDRSDLIDCYKNSHFLFLHLNNYKAFEKVLPSKIFEYAAFDIPIIAGVNGYTKEFINKYVSNSFVFNPCDEVTLINWLNNYQYHLEDRTDFKIKFDRNKICESMALSVVKYL